MNALIRARQEQRITDAIHAMLAAYPGRNDLWIITEVADEHGWTLAEVQPVFDRRFKDHGAC